MLTEYVVGFAFDEQPEPPIGFAPTKVLLIQKAKPDWQKGKLNGIGGKVEPGEAPSFAMAREFREECGISTEPVEWEHFLTLESERSRVCFFRTFEVDIMRARTVEAEPILWVFAREVAKGEVVVQARVIEAVPNLCWVVPMALTLPRGERIETPW